MKLHYIVLLIAFHAEAGNIGLQGEISLKIQVPSVIESYKKRTKDLEDPVGEISHESEMSEVLAGSKSSEKLASRVNVSEKTKGGMTVAPVLECMYQFPEEAQVQALLSNMMNQLTKMFVQASDMLKSEDDGTGARRRGDSRFRIISRKKTDFFEDIYRKMTQQYLAFYNTTTIRVDRAGRSRDPCANQREMKELWKDLLDNSLTTFRQAALRCIDENLRATGSGPESRVRARLTQYLLRELKKIRLSQLALLCDKFQLCYHDLLRRQI